MEPIDITHWHEDWQSAKVCNGYLVHDPAIGQPGFFQPRKPWSTLNQFGIALAHCRGADATRDGVFQTVTCVTVEIFKSCHASSIRR